MYRMGRLVKATQMVVFNTFKMSQFCRELDSAIEAIFSYVHCLAYLGQSLSF